MARSRGAGAPSLAALISRADAVKLRPVETWNPAYCGEIPMRIDRDGRWHYMGSAIERPALVALFASILRREADGRYCLVTPVEKVGIAVDDAPFLAVEMKTEGARRERAIGLRTNLGEWVLAGADHPLRFALEDGTGGLKPYIGLRRGLEALLSRALVFDLIELAEERRIEDETVLGIAAGGAFFRMPEPEAPR